MVRRFNANGEYVSKEQFCKICHLKKSKARQLLQSGLVPCIDTGIPTARYRFLNHSSACLCWRTRARSRYWENTQEQAAENILRNILPSGYSARTVHRKWSIWRKRLLRRIDILRRWKAIIGCWWKQNEEKS